MRTPPPKTHICPPPRTLTHLPGTLPPLPPSLSLLDLGSNQRLGGDIGALELGALRELRLGNNSFSGWVPKSAAASK